RPAPTPERPSAPSKPERPERPANAEDRPAGGGNSGKGDSDGGRPTGGNGFQPGRGNGRGGGRED
ncbi:MAG: hypothetical protein ACKOB9_08635, partial [Solirubrobacterales bacterium]